MDEKNEVSCGCKFCEFLSQLIDLKEYYQSRRPTPGYVDVYTVALVDKSYYNGECTGSASYGGYELNFCPTCGKPIKEEINYVHQGNSCDLQQLR